MLTPVVQRALEALTSRIGTIGDLGNADEHSDAAETLSQLHDAGERFEAEAIAAWASLNGWSPKGVARIRTLANDVLTGSTWRPGVLGGSTKREGSETRR